MAVPEKPASPPEVDRPRSRSSVERGNRTVVVETPSGKQQFDVGTHVAKTKGLVFDGGATGPGGFATAEFVPRAQLHDVPAVTVLAQGGTEGAGCFSVSLKSAPGLAHRALDPIARATRLEFDG